jgi:hypothetical protein
VSREREGATGREGHSAGTDDRPAWGNKEIEMSNITFPYITANGTPVVPAMDRDMAARALGVDRSDVVIIDELSPRDRHELLVSCVEARMLFGVAC